MELTIQYTEPPTSARQGAMFGAGKFAATMVGVYGYVREHFIKTATVSVELFNGILLHSVAVPSRTWIDETAPNVTGTVDLPPVNSFVFVLLPYGMENVTGAIVLFSVFNNRVPKQEARLVEGEEKKVVEVLSGNIKTTYDRETGNYKIEDLDDADNFVIELDKSNSRLHVKDWSGNDILANDSGIVITDTNGNTISMQSSKVLVNGHLEVLQ